MPDALQMFHAGTHAAQQGIDECHGGHGLYDDDCPGNDDGVMAAFDIDIH